MAHIGSTKNAGMNILKRNIGRIGIGSTRNSILARASRTRNAPITPAIAPEAPTTGVTASGISAAWIPSAAAPDSKYSAAKSQRP